MSARLRTAHRGGVTAALWLVLVASCEYHEQVGRSGPSVDAGRECSGFRVPTGDCTSGRTSCSFTSDCDGIDVACNQATKRCFADSDRCVGPPCLFDVDCPVAERCNQTVGVCYALHESQACMPCFLLDSDCGLSTCDPDPARCR